MNAKRVSAEAVKMPRVEARGASLLAIKLPCLLTSIISSTLESS
jgi:hypothetical protein